MIEVFDKPLPRMFANLKRALHAFKENPAYRAIISLGLAGPQWTGTNYYELAKQGYVQNADVYACVNLKAQALGGITWTMYRGRGKKKKEIEDGPEQRLIDRPNMRMGQASFFEHLSAYLDLSGNSYTVRNGPDNKPPTELWVLRPDRMRVESGNAMDPIAGYTYTAAAPVAMMPDRNGQTVMHLKLFHPINDWYGLSPIQAAARNVDQSNSAQAWNVSLIQNTCRPSGYWTVKETLGDVEFERLKAQLLEHNTGPNSAGKPLLAEGGAEWKAMSLTPAEMDWLKGDQATTRKICSAFGVPPELIGVMTSGALNDTNFVQARRKFYMETILPRADFVRGELNAWLCPLFGDDVSIDYDRDDIEAIQEDRKVVWDRAMAAGQSGFLTIDEVRNEMGFDPCEGGNVRLIPANMIPVGADEEFYASAMEPDPLPTDQIPPGDGKPAQLLQ